ncbi:pantetheine-phosphate adenylyltransferase [Thermosulfuriphilus ammonigenes]|uniref:Phosphopantetheine adenylyltransferase n=1 Tax=Thermosulfuriphilus ammonigenes TaxID=1936021 RepID=A0A6G7PW83_9BACT|nr:pantetheine-phosphate adenylyltransferase [Thermosulfuriphilus ammonigenes]MBA2848114.1 pantetheine-phosphate adenylyltransferase [Thermosulfuriphilus ammonigenes]QIJ71708.1 pantetheine-phosphate adenylyltransferase [Thermosulfuriphilus ammonigenes]
MRERIAIYPGTFDPITNGHLDVIQRGVRLFDRLIVAIGLNPAKKPLFSLEERLDMIRETVAGMERVEVDYFQGLLVEYAQKRGACAVIRGLRAVSDFEYEFQIALMNRKLCPNLETVFLMPGAKWIFISSSIIKEVARFGGCLEGLVPESVERRLKERFSSRCPGGESG